MDWRLVLKDSILIGHPATAVLFGLTSPASRSLQPLDGRLSVHKSVSVTVYNAPNADGRKAADDVYRTCTLYAVISIIDYGLYQNMRQTLYGKITKGFV